MSINNAARLIVMENCQPESGDAYASSNSSVKKFNNKQKKKVSVGGSGVNTL